ELMYHDIGDDLSRADKLSRVAEFGSLSGISQSRGWLKIEPDEHGDWLQQRDRDLASFAPMGSKRGGEHAIFELLSNGVVSNRDAWVYNYSRAELLSNCSRMISFFNK